MAKRKGSQSKKKQAKKAATRLAKTTGGSDSSAEVADGVDDLDAEAGGAPLAKPSARSSGAHDADEDEAPRELGLPPRWLGFAAAALCLGGAVMGMVPDAELAHPEIWTWGLIALLVGAVAGGRALTLDPAASAGLRRVLLGTCTVLGAVALTLLLRRNGDIHTAPFQAAHANFAGVPAPLAFVALLAGAWAVARRPDAPTLVHRAALAAGLLWATAVLFFPFDTFGAVELPIAAGLQLLEQDGAQLQGLVFGLGLISVAAGWVLALRSPEGGDGTDAVSRTLTLVCAAGAGGLVVYHAVAPLLFAELSLAAVGGGLAIAGAIGLLSISLAHLLDAWTEASGERVSADLERAGRFADWTVPAIVIGIYFLLKTHAWHAVRGDENIYFYMAEDLANGRLPYVDYFFAHPPLHVLVPGAFFSVFGYSFGLAKLFSVAAGGIAGLAVWLIGRRNLGRWSAAFAMIAFLFASETLKATTNMTGINLTVMWLTLGIWQALKGRGLTAGVLLGLAATTGFYSMGAICAVAALMFFRPKDASDAKTGGWRTVLPGFLRGLPRAALRLVVGFVLVWGGINLLFLIAAGDAFVEGVYSYHTLKGFRDSGMQSGALLGNFMAMIEGREFTKDLYYHAHLWVMLWLAPAVGALAYYLDPEKRRKPFGFLDPRRLWRDGVDGIAGILWLIALTLFFQYSLFRELYSFYWTLIYPTLALLLGYVLVRGATLAASGIRAAVAHAPWRVLAGGAAIVGFATWVPIASNAQLEAFLSSEFYDVRTGAKPMGTKADYEWKEASIWPGLSGVVRDLFWEDSRLRGNMSAGYLHFLWTKKRGFESIDRIAAFVASQTTEGETITGASTIAPLVALESGRRLAGGEVDTNTKRFKTGLLTRRQFWESACRDQLRWVLSTSSSFLTRQTVEASPTMLRWFSPSGPELAIDRVDLRKLTPKERAARLAAANTVVFHDQEIKYGSSFPITLYRRTDTHPAPDRVCEWEGGELTVRADAPIRAVEVNGKEHGAIALSDGGKTVTLTKIPLYERRDGVVVDEAKNRSTLEYRVTVRLLPEDQALPPKDLDLISNQAFQRQARETWHVLAAERTVSFLTAAPGG